jgi:hypothetical protein
MNTKSSPDLERYLELRDVPLSSELTLDEARSIARLHVEVVEIRHNSRPYSKMHRIAARTSLGRRIAIAKSVEDRKRLALELSLFSRDGNGQHVPADDIHAGMERERHEKRIAAAKLLEDPYRRELARLRSHRGAILALDLQSLDLAPSVTLLRRIDEVIARLEAGQTKCSRVISGADSILMPADLAADLGFDFEAVRTASGIPAPRLENEWGELHAAAEHISTNIARFQLPASDKSTASSEPSRAPVTTQATDSDALLETEDE